MISARVILLFMLISHLQTSIAAAPPAFHIAQAIPAATLQGQGTYRWFGLEIYQASLWRASASMPLFAQTFALDLRYARTLKGEAIAARSVEEMQHLGMCRKEDCWMDTMRKLFPDVERGTHLTGIYLPAQGVRFYRDGVLLGVIEDQEFARAFFSIWLAPTTRAPKLRAQLLGNVQP